MNQRDVYFQLQNHLSTECLPKVACPKGCGEVCSISACHIAPYKNNVQPNLRLYHL